MGVESSSAHDRDELAELPPKSNLATPRRPRRRTERSGARRPARAPSLAHAQPRSQRVATAANACGCGSLRRRQNSFFTIRITLHACGSSFAHTRRTSLKKTEISDTHHIDHIDHIRNTRQRHAQSNIARLFQYRASLLSLLSSLFSLLSSLFSLLSLFGLSHRGGGGGGGDARSLTGDASGRGGRRTCARCSCSRVWSRTAGRRRCEARSRGR